MIRKYKIKARSPRKESELQLQIAVVRYLQMQPREILFNGSAGGIRTSMSQAKKMKASGYRKGWPDLLIMEPRGEFHGLAIELKVKGNYPSAEQKKVIQDLKERGYWAEVATGFDQAKEIIDFYFKL